MNKVSSILTHLLRGNDECVNLKYSPTVKTSDEQFEKLALANRDLQLELTATEELIIIPPTGGETGSKNLDIEAQLWFWSRQNELRHKLFKSPLIFY